MNSAIHEFLLFGLKQARACVFVGSFFVLLFLSNHIPLFGLARYDFLFIAAVGSYISQAWKIMKFRLSDYEHYAASAVLCFLIYLNFFTNHYIYDFRYFLIAAVFAFFWKTRVYFTVSSKERYMPMNIGFLLIASFIWVAENISTYLGAWKYPDQVHMCGAWSPPVKSPRGS
ncbi:MAG: DUF817 family protein [bacterium]